MLKIKQNLIAPCGMDCGVCLGYLREKNRCPGCRNIDSKKDPSISRARCRIKNCEKLKNTKSGFCYECKNFPCQRIKHLDKRYTTKYHMSEIENLETIRKSGIRKFLQIENKKWKCKKCGGTICCHRGACIVCGKKI
jgi:hypothetical protein